MTEVITRAEMIERNGSIPPIIPKDGYFKWTIHRAHASVTWITEDGGETWGKAGVIWAEARNQRDLAALEAQRVQRELK